MGKKLKFSIDPNHFYKWVLYYLTHHIELGIGDFHKQLIASFRHDKIAIAAPRGHAKSTWASFFLPIYLLLEFPEIEITLVSATGALAEEWLAKIKTELEMNELIREVYGEQEGETWSKTDIRTTLKSRLVAKGAGKQIRGTRPNVIIGDDLETDEMVLSPEQRRKFDDWFYNTLLQTLPGGEGKVIVVGTILHPESFLSELIKYGRHGWRTRHFAALLSDGSALWPEMYTAAKLEDIKKEMGEYGFAQEYMNDPIADSERTFQKDNIQYYDKVPEGCIYFTTVDPALEIGSGNDYTAIVTCAVDSDDNIYVVNVIHKRMLPKETIDLIFEVQKKFNPLKVGIETLGFQKMLKHEIESQRGKRKVYPVLVELKSGGRRKNLRIQSLQPRFESHKIFIRSSMKSLETELLRFPSTKCHDDIIDALAYQLDIIRPADKEKVVLDPNSFLGSIENRRKKSAGPRVIWGNHKLRGYNW